MAGGGKEELGGDRGGRETNTLGVGRADSSHNLGAYNDRAKRVCAKQRTKRGQDMEGASGGWRVNKAHAFSMALGTRGSRHK